MAQLCYIFNLQLGVAYGFNLEFDMAVTSLEDAIIVLKKRVDNLRAGKVKTGKAGTESVLTFTRH